MPAHIKKICIKNLDKPRDLAPSMFTTHRQELLDDPDINVIVELIDDPLAAFEVVRDAMKKGKSVISANKKMIADNLDALLLIQKENNVSFLYEGACCASIPIIRNLEEYYDNDLLTSLRGIVNGSTNYILTELAKGGLNYEQALRQAQEVGFAESDPSLDVEGFDAKYKLGILVLHAFGIKTHPSQIHNYGITRINRFDLDYARQNGYSIKLMAHAERVDDDIYAYCMPTFVPGDSFLSRTSNEYNAVVLSTSFSEQQILYGKGAGDTPTGSAVLSDVSALTYGYKYEYKKHGNSQSNLRLSDEFSIQIYARSSEKDALDDRAFDKIHERYEGTKYSYVIGEIKMSTLRKSTLFEDSRVSLVCFNP